MVFHQDRLLNRALPPTGFPFVASLVAAPIGWSSINSVSLLLGLASGRDFSSACRNHGTPPHTPLGRAILPAARYSLTVSDTPRPAFQPLQLGALAPEGRQFVLLELLGGRASHGVEQGGYPRNGKLHDRPERGVGVVRPLLLLPKPELYQDGIEVLEIGYELVVLATVEGPFGYLPLPPLREPSGERDP